jgi:hypothetical protein
MRASAVRTISISRRQARGFDHRRPPIAAQRSTSARAGIQIAGGGAAFLVVYVTLQLFHALGRDPSLVTALSPIPLFARFAASSAFALPAGLALGLLVRDRERFLSRLPALLAAAIALFIIAVVFFS